MDWGKADEVQDPRYMKKSFKQLRSSIQSYASSSLQRVAELQLSNHIPLSRPSDSGSKQAEHHAKKKRLSNKVESSALNHPDRRNFTSPSKAVVLPLESPAQSVKYIQMRRSENGRIMSHVRNTSLTEKKAISIKEPTKNTFKSSHTSKTKMGSAPMSNHGLKSREPTAKSSLRENETTTSKLGSNKMLNQILSLYDKKATSRPSEAFANAKVMVPKFNLNAPETILEKRPESSIRKQLSSGTPPFTNNYLNRVKEILSARKPSYRQSHVDPKRSPKSHKNRWTFFSSLKEGDLLKIYDMSSTENLAKHLQEKDGLLSRGSIARPDSQPAFSRQNHTNNSVLERDTGSEEQLGEERLRGEERVPRESVMSEATTTNLGAGHYHDGRLGDAMNKLLQLLSSRDNSIAALRSENRGLKATVAGLVQQVDFLKHKLSLYTET